MLRTNRDYLRSQRLAERRRRRLWVRGVLIVILSLFLLGSLILVARMDAFTVRQVAIVGSTRVGDGELSAMADQDATGTWMYLIPRRNIFLYPTAHVATDIQAAYPQFSNVVVKRSGLSTIKIYVTERQPRALWCDGTAPSETSASVCYLLDQTGYIYSTNTGSTSVQSDAYLRFYGGVEDMSAPIGNVLVSSSSFNEISLLAERMRQAGLVPESVLIRNPNEFSVHIAHNGNIIFSNTKPIQDEFENLKSALKSDAFKATSSNSTSTVRRPFEYIDTRFGNKIFYKLK